MKITLTDEMVKTLGHKKLADYGVNEENKHWSREYSVDITRHTNANVERLAELMRPLAAPPKGTKATRGARAIVQACEIWLAAQGGAEVKPKSVEQFEALLEKRLAQSWTDNVEAGRPAGVRLYKREEKRGVWECFHVNNTKYVPPHRRDNYTSPAHADIEMIWQEFGGTNSHTAQFQAENIEGRTVMEALVARGYMIENAELRAEYDARRAQFLETAGKIGKQFMATGDATDDCDGNREPREDRWYWRQVNSIQMDKGGEPSRVVVDLFYENKDKRDSNKANIDKNYWPLILENDEKRDEDEDDVKATEKEWPAPELPLHPMLAVFDMKRHMRLRVDIGQLQEYKYDAQLASKLILPEDSRNLVEMLLAHKGQFRDIVKGKSGGAIILCAGVPGTGKTLTAEVYAEVMAKPLYTVQASQLGTDADALEDELMKTFVRAARWNAIMLIDEADVYVHARGDDLQQNAIVGVFLRVLEYYKGVLFMTTNRSDLVDDAIASRCVARIDYNAPSIDDQKKIWAVLSKTAGIDIASDVIAAVAARYPKLTGRDVKNLLKLAKLVSDSRECDITLDVIRFVKRFKPTIGTEAEAADNEPVTLPAPPGERGEEAESAAPAPAPVKVLGLDVVDASDWKTAVLEVFEDGAPHGAAETKDAAKKVKPDIHPNAVTSFVVSLVKGGQLERLSSGLYRKPSVEEKMAG